MYHYITRSAEHLIFFIVHSLADAVAEGQHIPNERCVGVEENRNTRMVEYCEQVISQFKIPVSV